MAALHILIIEDDQTALHMIKSTLEIEGHTVHGSAGRADTVELLEIGTFDLVLLDLTLTGSGTSGMEILANIRAAGHALPIIVVSGRDDGRDMQAAYGAGADAYIVKPFGIDEIVETVSRFGKGP